MEKDINIKELSNTKLFEMVDILSKNHEKLKFEIITLCEMLNTVEKEYVEITEELNSRT